MMKGFNIKRATVVGSGGNFRTQEIIVPVNGILQYCSIAMDFGSVTDGETAFAGISLRQFATAGEFNGPASTNIVDGPIAELRARIRFSTSGLAFGSTCQVWYPELPVYQGQRLYCHAYADGGCQTQSGFIIAFRFA